MTVAEFVKLFPVYVQNSYISNAISKRIAYGEALRNEQKASVLLVEAGGVARELACFLGKPPIDVSEAITFEGVTYDGETVICDSIESVRQLVQKLLYKPNNIEEYEVGALFYYCTKNNLIRQRQKAVTG